jgi:hypothetical protein
MYYIVLGEFAGLFYSPVNWESFNKRKIIYNKGFEVDEESGNVQVYLAESIKKENNGNDREQVIIRDFPHGNRDRKYPEYHQNRITISAMIKKMNMLTFMHVAFSKGENNKLLKLPT